MHVLLPQTFGSSVQSVPDLGPSQQARVGRAIITLPVIVVLLVKATISPVLRRWAVLLAQVLLRMVAPPLRKTEMQVPSLLLITLRSTRKPPASPMMHLPPLQAGSPSHPHLMLWLFSQRPCALSRMMP